MPSLQYDASTSSLSLENVYLPGRDPRLPVLFRVLGRHPLRDMSLASGSTYFFSVTLLLEEGKGMLSITKVFKSHLGRFKT